MIVGEGTMPMLRVGLIVAIVCMIMGMGMGMGMGIPTTAAGVLVAGRRSRAALSLRAP
jgi:hypothetical protein